MSLCIRRTQNEGFGGEIGSFLNIFNFNSTAPQNSPPRQLIFPFVRILNPVTLFALPKYLTLVPSIKITFFKVKFELNLNTIAIHFRFDSNLLLFMYSV